MSANALKERLRADLKAAMRERKAPEVSLIRTLIAAIDNAEAQPIEGFEERNRLRETVGEVARRGLSATELEAVLAAETQSRLAAAKDYERKGLAEEAAGLRAEVALIANYRA